MNIYKMNKTKTAVFSLNHKDYIKEITCLEDIISLKKGSMLYKCIEQYYRKKQILKVIEEMNKWYSDLLITLKEPELLKYENEQHIMEMEKYLLKNKGNLLYEFPVRKEILENEIKLYIDTYVKNNMVILSYIDDIKKLIDEYKNILNDTLIKRTELRREKRIINESKIVKCECGKEFKLWHKSRHLSSKFHQDYVEQKELIVPDDSKMN